MKNTFKITETQMENLAEANLEKAEQIILRQLADAERRNTVHRPDEKVGGSNYTTFILKIKEGNKCFNFSK